MKPSLALNANRDAIRALTKRFRLGNPRVFGSTLKNLDNENSDLDILVDAYPGASLLDIGGLQVELEALLRVRVDVLTPADLPASFRQAVVNEARPV